MSNLCQLPARFFPQLQSSQWLLLFVVFTVSAMLLRKARLSRWAGRADLPPGPPGLPIVGHFHLLGQLPHKSLCKLSKTYGPLMGLRLGSVPVVVASSSQMAKEILQTHDAHLAHRPQTAAAVYLGFDSRDMAYASPGPRWKFLRQLYATELFSAKKMESFRSVREGEARDLARAVLRQSGRPAEVRVSLTTASNNINSVMAMGKKLKDVSGGEQDLAGLLREALHLCGVFYLGDYIPWLAWLDPHSYLKRMKETAKRIEALLQAVIDDRSRRQQQQKGHPDEQPPPPPQDLLDALFAAASDNDMGDDVAMSNRDMMAAVLDVFLGGSDTSAAAVEWALAELINHPQAMRKVHEELDRVVGRERLVEESDIPNLAYLGCVITESMRLHPLAPILVPRESVQGCAIGGFTVPAGTRVLVNAWAIARDPATWPSPAEFLPERFLNSGLNLASQSFDFLPFGTGRRRCPGVALGIANLHLMLATLAQGFEWQCESTLDMTEKFGISVNMETPLRAIATPRLPLHLLE